MNTHPALLYATAVVLLITAMSQVSAQEATGTGATAMETELHDRLEGLSETLPGNTDFSELTARYDYYARHPVNLNGNELRELVEMGLLTDAQCNILHNSRATLGPFRSYYELAYLPGFDSIVIGRLLPFITLRDEQNAGAFSLHRALVHGQHELSFSGSRLLQDKAGQLRSRDSALFYPGSTYLGTADQYRLRYRYRYGNRLRWGFTMDKDAGEPVWPVLLPDTIARLIRGKTGLLGDFFAAYVHYEGPGFLRQLALGDFHMEAGQGLTLWSGLRFLNHDVAGALPAGGRLIRPNTSADENRFLRGAALTLGVKKLSLTLFCGLRRQDANVITSTEADPFVSSLQETGLHRTLSEIADKNSIRITHAGTHLRYRTGIVQWGLTALRSTLNHPLLINPVAYRTFDFQGNALTSVGTDYRIDYKGLHLTGEVSASLPGGMAQIHCLAGQLTDRLLFTLQYHRFGLRYQTLLSNPGTGGDANESGILFSFRLLVHRSLMVSGYTEYLRYPWISYRADAPSESRSAALKLEMAGNLRTQAYLRFRYRRRNYNHPDPWLYTHRLSHRDRSELRLHYAVAVTAALLLTSRIEGVWARTAEEKPRMGYLLSQDLRIRPARQPWSLQFRYALFSSDDYDTRLFSMEPDLPYSFSIPALFGEGQRVILMFSLAVTPDLKLYFRLANTHYYHQQTIGSGADLIRGPDKTTLGIALRYKIH